MISKSQRGLSPVVATVLLISLALILAVIIYFYARGFVGEVPEKFGRDISLACQDVSFDAEAKASVGGVDITIINRGNVPLYGMEVRSRRDGSVKSESPFGNSIGIGQSNSQHLSITDVSNGDDLILTPILLGTQGDLKKQYTCDDKTYGKIITVQ